MLVDNNMDGPPRLQLTHCYIVILQQHGQINMTTTGTLLNCYLVTAWTD